MRRSRRALAEAARAADEALLTSRLRLLGLTRRVEVHENRTVLVSLTKQGALRVHRGYAYASDRVLNAIVTFVSASAKAAERRRAEHALVGFPVEEFVRPAPGRRRTRERIQPGDRRLLTVIRRIYERLNRRHFDGKLGRIEFRLSTRMQTRLGELTVDPRTHRAVEIAISRRHIEHDGWVEVEHTLLHEMIHQWQVEAGLEPDHGPTFQQKATEVGVAPAAKRLVSPKRRAARERR